MKRTVVEIARFKLNESVTDQIFLIEAERIQESFLEKQRGYLNRELLKDENGQWFDILHWASMAEAQVAAQVMTQEPACQQFIQMMDPQSINMFHLERQKEWGL